MTTNEIVAEYDRASEHLFKAFLYQLETEMARTLYEECDGYLELSPDDNIRVSVFNENEYGNTTCARLLVKGIEAVAEGEVIVCCEGDKFIRLSKLEGEVDVKEIAYIVNKRCFPDF